MPQLPGRVDTTNRADPGPDTLISLPGSPDRPEVANGSGVEREKGVALYIRRNGCSRRGMEAHHLLVLLEHSPDHLIDEIVGEVLVRNGKIVQTDRLIRPVQRKIDAWWNT